MTKKTVSEINMSEEIRTVLTEDPTLTLSLAIDAIAAKYPKLKINKNSFQVAFYTSRKKLGAIKKKKVARRTTRKPAIHKVATQSVQFDITVLQTAVKFLREVGSIDNAIEIIKAVETVQVH